MCDVCRRIDKWQKWILPKVRNLLTMLVPQTSTQNTTIDQSLIGEISPGGFDYEYAVYCAKRRIPFVYNGQTWYIRSTEIDNCKLVLRGEVWYEGILNRS